MNMLTNLHIQNLFQDDTTNIISLVSPTVDSSTMQSLIEAALSIVTIDMFPCALCLGFPLMLFVLVMEKEEKIKDLLDINGLVTSSYWVAFYVYNFIVLSFVAILFLGVAKFTIKIEYFEKSNILLIFWFLSIWNLAQISFALFTSTFIKTSSMATLAGYTISIFLILFLCMFSQFIFPSPAELPLVMYLIPQTPFVRFFYLTISRCVSDECLDSFDRIFGEKELRFVFIAMHLNALGYFFVGLIFNEPTIIKMLRLQGIIDFFNKEQSIKSIEKAVARNRTSSGLTKLSGEFSSVLTDALIENNEDNLESENYNEKHKSSLDYQELVENTYPNDPNYVLVAKGLSKSYPCSQGIKRALSNFSIKIEKGKIFGLLGPNGAGKTTFLNCVTGSIIQDKGKAWICGNSTTDRNLHAGNIGFCPQFDILWPQLNVYEHLKFLALFKGMDGELVDKSVRELIDEVDLEVDYQKLACRLSGGMKRRCSLAMALTGNPKIIFLDEPSSGLDPVKRRHFWSLVKKVTQQKAVLLTTHLMEEADTLCSEIAIVTSGKMRCVGNSIYLKKAFTRGIKVQIVLNHDVCTTGQFMTAIKKKLKGVSLDTEFQGTLTLVVQDDSMRKKSYRRAQEDDEFTSQSDISEDIDEISGNKLSSIFSTMQEFITEKGGNQPMVNDWSISLGSLEDVFLTVVKTYRENNIEKV